MTGRSTGIQQGAPDRSRPIGEVRLLDRMESQGRGFVRTLEANLDREILKTGKPLAEYLVVTSAGAETKKSVVFGDGVEGGEAGGEGEGLEPREQRAVGPEGERELVVEGGEENSQPSGTSNLRGTPDRAD